MRKLSKKISMLMVLAMLVSLFSGIVSASAASAWSFKSSKYDVEVGETIEMEKNEYADFDLFKNDAAPEGYTVKWSSSDPDAVWVNSGSGQLRADKFKTADYGDKATISATFTNTTTGKSATRSFVIVVAEKAEEVEYAITTKSGDVVLGEETLVAGIEYALTSTVTADGKAVDATVAYTVDGKDVTALKFDVADEYTVVATATIDGEVVKTAETKVVVIVDNSFDIKQTSMTSFTLTFAEGKDLSQVTKANIAVAEAAAIDGAKVVVPVKDVTVKDNVITVSLYQELAKDSYIFAKFLDGEYLGFKVSKGDVKRIEVSSKSVMINEYVALDIKLFDENEIDITATADLSRVTIEAVAGKENCAISDKSILFWEAGKTANVVATYHTYDYLTNNDGTEVVYKSEAATITAVDKKVSYSAVDGWAAAAAGYDKTKLSYSGNVKVALNDTGKYLVGKLVETTITTKTETKNVYTCDLTGYSFASADPEKLLVMTDGELIPVATGTVDVLLKDAEGKIKSVASVTVLAKREPSTISIAPSKTTMSTAGNDSIVATLTVNDQYNEKCTVVAGDITIKNVATNAAAVIDGDLISYADGKLTFKGFAAGTYTFSVEVNKKVAYVSFKVQAPEEAATFKLEATTKALSTKIAADAAKNLADIYKDAVVSIASYDKYNYKTGDANSITSSIDSPAATAIDGAIVADQFYVVLNGPDGYKNWLTVDNGNVVLKNLKITDNKIEKAPVGTYTVTLYKSAAVGETGKVSFAYKDSISITVTDGQPGYTAKLVKNTSDQLASDVVAATGSVVEVVIDECFEIKNANGETKNLDGYYALEQKNANNIVVFISVKFDEAFIFADDTYYVEQKINLLTSPITLK